MPRYHYRRHSKNDGRADILLLVGIIAVITLYSKLTMQTTDLIIMIGLLLAGVIIVLVLGIRYRRPQYEEQKLRILNHMDINSMDGLAFEQYVAKLLKSLGYTKVVLTERYDLGVDIIAVRDGIRWGVQVKRYSTMVGAEAVRQVVTAIRTYHCQRAMVVTNNTFSRPATILAATNNCVLIGKDQLAEWILTFQGHIQ